MSLANGAPPITGFARVQVTVSTGLLSDTLVYRARPDPVETLTGARDISLSVSFSDAIKGEASLAVVLLSDAGVPLGHGNTGVTISSGRVAYAVAEIFPGAPPAAPDAGQPDALAMDAGGDASPNFACTPSTALGCQPGFTCGVSCLVSGEPAALCIAAGMKQPGEPCSGNGECAPGSQCFRDVCGVSVCRRYCGEDADCPTGGSCFTEIQCSMPPRATGVRICSQPCDPRGDAKSGCAEGLRCFIFPGEIADCDCVGAQRVGGDGEPCSDSGSCAPGFLCVTMGTTPQCRPICRLDQPATCAGGRTCQMLTNPDHATFGACVP